MNASANPNHLENGDEVEIIDGSLKGYTENVINKNGKSKFRIHIKENKSKFIC